MDGWMDGWMGWTIFEIYFLNAIFRLRLNKHLCIYGAIDVFGLRPFLFRKLKE